MDFLQKKPGTGVLILKKKTLRWSSWECSISADKLPEFDFTLNLAEANLYKLNFDQKDTTSSLSMLLTSNFKGNNIDNLDGEIKLLNSRIKKYGQ